MNGAKIWITRSTVKERGEPIKVKEVSLTILDGEQENALHIPSAFSIPRSMFNMPSQKQSKSAKSALEGYHHLKGTKLAHVPASEVTILVASDIPDAFLQLELRRGKQDQPYAMLLHS